MDILKIAFPQWDYDLFMYLNSINADRINPVMLFLSAYSTWVVTCAVIIIYMIWKDHKQGLCAALFLLIGIGINSLTNNVVKIIIMRPRPGHNPQLQNFIHQLEDPGNSYSFFSAHSSNSICLALFTTLYFRNKYWGIAIFAGALLVAYSRIYVGKHYPIDVLVGLAYGLFSGCLAYWLYRKYSAGKIRTDRD